MLAENIVKDHHSIMKIGTMEITREAIEVVNKEEGLNYYQRISEWETKLELLEKWLKAPVEKKEPDEDCKLYAREEEKRVQQRRELEKHRIYTQYRLLKKEDKEIVMNENHKKKEVVMEVKQIDVTKGGVHYYEPE